MSRTLLITNARIHTGSALRPTARWLRIRDDRIVDLGQRQAPPECDHTLDAGGRTIIPGLIDAHLHLVMAGGSLSQLDQARINSREQFEAAIEQRHTELPEGEWLIAHDWSSDNWGGDLPDKHWLRPAGSRPVVCHRMDHHAVLVNDAVLNMIPRAALQSDPPGGRIVRDANNEPTGVFVEAAAWSIINPLIPRPSPEHQQQHLLAAQAHAHRHGITTVGTMEYARTVEEVFLPMRDRLTLRSRMTLLDRNWPLDTSIAPAIDEVLHERLKIIGFKAFIDGTLGSRTARLLEDYADDPGNRGLLIELAAEERLNEWVQHVAEAGYSPSMHAIGDEAVRLALDAIDAALGTRNSERIPRIEHAQQIDAADIPRFAGRIASMQPLHKADDGRYAVKRLGESRMRGFFPFRQLLDAGAILAFGSDWPIVTCDPMLGIRAATTGLTLDGQPVRTEENLTVEESLRAYTSGAAHALGMDDAGTLDPGRLADLVMLDRNPFERNWTRDTPMVLMTMVGGEVVYDALRTASIPGQANNDTQTLPYR